MKMRHAKHIVRYFFFFTMHRWYYYNIFGIVMILL